MGVKYGLLAAGAVSKSLIGQLPAKARDIGPVAGASYRVASRIANSLHAGYPVRSVSELNDVPVVLVHAPPDQVRQFLDLLEGAQIRWKAKPLIFCDCRAGAESIRRLNAIGANAASMWRLPVSGRIAIDGAPPALTPARRIARELKMKAIVIAPGAVDLFDAAVTLGTDAITPLIDSTAELLREAGLRDKHASRLAALLFIHTARDYAHSGRQSWSWYMRKPELDRIEAQIRAAGPRLGPAIRQLLLLGLDIFEKHADVAGELSDNNPAPLTGTASGGIIPE